MAAYYIDVQYWRAVLAGRNGGTREPQAETTADEVR